MKKIFLTLILTLTMALGNMPVHATGASDIPAESITFTDISGHWAESAIKKYADISAFAGNDGKFYPDQIITRSEFVLMLHKALGIKIEYFKAPDIKEFFEDVKNEDACASGLYDLVVSQIIDRKGSFKPNEVLPRDEMVHYIINAFKKAAGGNYTLTQVLPASFADNDEITSAYKNDIVEAVLLKIVYGKDGNIFHPQDGCTRAEAAVVIDRLMNVLQKLKGTVDVQPSVETDSSGLKLKLTIINRSKEPITINHTSGQKYDFALLDSGRNELYRWSSDRSFITALSTTVIDAEKSVEFSALLKGDAYISIKDRIKYMRAYIVGNTESFNINPEGYEVEIK